MIRSLRFGRSGRSLYFFFFLLVVAGTSCACVASTSIVARNTAELREAPASSVKWFAPDDRRDGTSLTRWRRSVGPPVTPLPVPALDAAPHSAITVVSWNVAVGDADVVGFVRRLPASDRPLVLLLQEVYRGGAAVPAQLDRGSEFAGRLGCGADRAGCRQIEEIGQQLGLKVYYVPSMRNGGPTSDEDRGNAILSSLPLTDLRAIELPFERQRRVAIAATLTGFGPAGEPWRVRVVSAHLDNMAGLKRGWIGAEYGRARQARSLASLLNDGEPTILAGDFNTWFGFSIRPTSKIAHAFPETRVTDRRPTFRGCCGSIRVLSMAPAGESSSARASRYGSITIRSSVPSISIDIIAVSH